MLLKNITKKLPSILIGGSSLLFAIIFFGYKDLFLATKVLFYSMLASAVILLLFRCEVKKMQWITIIGTLLFAGLTYFLQDELFILWRSTITSAVIGFILLGFYAFNYAPLETFLGTPLELKLPKEVWLKVNVIWAMYMFLCALINTVLVLFFSREIWVAVKTFGVPVLSFCFMIGLFSYLYKKHRQYCIED